MAVAGVEGDHGGGMVQVLHAGHGILQGGHVVQVAGHPFDLLQQGIGIGAVVAEDLLHAAAVASFAVQRAHLRTGHGQFQQQVAPHDTGPAGHQHCAHGAKDTRRG